MSPRALILAVALSAVGLSAAPLAQTAPTADELVAMNIQSKGGLEKLKSIQTVKQTSQLTMPGGRGSIVVYGKRPDRERQEMTVAGQTIVNGFDGRQAWMINPLAGVRTPVVITGPQADSLREQSNFDGPLVDYKARGYRLDFVGAESAGGARLYHLRLTDPAGQVQDCYLDQQTGLEAKITSRTDNGTYEEDLSDYRDVNGVKVPFSIHTSFNGVPEFQIQVSTVEFNLPLDDGLFKIPQS